MLWFLVLALFSPVWTFFLSGCLFVWLARPQPERAELWEQRRATEEAAWDGLWHWWRRSRRRPQGWRQLPMRVWLVLVATWRMKWLHPLGRLDSLAVCGTATVAAAAVGGTWLERLLTLIRDFARARGWI